MINAIGIVASGTAATKFHLSLKSKGIYLEICQNAADLLERMPQAQAFDAVLLSESAVKEDGFKEILEACRNQDSTIRIICIKDTPEQDYSFEVWCYERQIYDILYPSRKMEVGIDETARAIQTRRIDPEHRPELPTPPEECCPESSAVLKLPESFKKLSFPDIKLPHWLNKTPNQLKQSVVFPASQQNRRVIGIIGAARGLGATMLTVQLAGHLNQSGQGVSVLAMDGSSDLKLSGLQEKSIPVCIPPVGKLADWDTFVNCGQFVMMDFGAVYLRHGNKLPAYVKKALNACGLRVYLVSDDPWHIQKGELFEDDDRGLIYPCRNVDAATVLYDGGISI
ncbi:MAG: hypothetical protein FWH04_09975 [Oscillospiraceae bacterium]|nr:hypothetical protein [Oscillospiraceae bacterium]